MQETRQFRGISKRLAIQYLENLGGERIDGRASEGEIGGGDENGDGGGNGGGDENGGRDENGDDTLEDVECVDVEGADWSAAVSSETVTAAGSIELTEVTVEFEGEDGVLEELLEDFERKAIRAGG